MLMNITLFDFVIWGGVIFAVLNVVFMGVLLINRYVQRRRMQHRASTEARWSGVLTSVREGASVDVPDVRNHEFSFLLPLWISSFEAASSEEQEKRLVRLAENIGLDQYVEERFEDGDRQKDHQVILSLGFLQKRGYRQRLTNLIQEGNAFISVVAARALVELDGSDALNRIRPVLYQRTDWPLVHIKYILSELDEDTLSDRIPELIKNAPGHQLKRLVPMLCWIDRDQARSELNHLLDRTTDDEQRAAILRVYDSVAGTDDRDHIRPYLQSDTYFVRAQAARVLGKIGTQEDEDALLEKTSDENYWVRYRAAQALLQLPDMSDDRIRDIRDACSDPYARDILEQCIGEKRIS